MLKYSILTVVLTAILCTGCRGQSQQRGSDAGNNKLVGGGCDGCELMYVDMPTDINAIDTSLGWEEPGQKLLITGIVYQRDGRTPARP